MNRGQIRTEIRQLVSDTGTQNPRFSDSTLNLRIDEIHKEVGGMTKVLKSSATNTAVADVQEYALPESSDVLEIERVEFDSGDDARALKPKGMEELDYEDPSWRALEGKPEFYYLRGKNLGLVPRPGTSEAGKTIKIFYADKVTAFSADSDSPSYSDQYHKIIIDGVAAWCKREDGDIEDALFYEQRYENGKARMKVEQDARKGTVFIMKPG